MAAQANIKLDEDQRSAVDAPPRTVRIIAGPGSGKTRTLCARVCRFVEELGYESHEILVLAFNVKACLEVRRRLREMSPTAGARIKVCTYHALANSILRKDAHLVGLPKHFKVEASTAQLERLATEVMGALEADESKVVNSLVEGSQKVLLDKISVLKNLSPECFFQSSAERQQTSWSIARAGFLLEKLLRERDSIVFDDMMVLALEILDLNSSTAEWVKGRYRAVFVDEYQDINPAQLQLLEAHCSPEGALTVVGDDDQCIYEWRGANPRHLIDFQDRFPQSTTHELGWNYRSSDGIVAAAEGVINSVKDRVPKQLAAARGPGPPIEIRLFDCGEDECSFVEDRIQALLIDGVPGNEIAVLARTKALLRTVISKLQATGIAVRGDAPLRSVQMKRLVAMLRTIAYGPGDPSFPEALTLGKRRLGRTAYSRIFSEGRPSPNDLEQRLREWCSGAHPEGKELQRAWSDCREFSDRLDALRAIADQNPHSTLEIVDGIRSAFLPVESPELDREGQALQTRPFDLVLRLAREQNTLVDLIDTIDELRALGSDDLSDAVTICTVHRAKGLEFDHVFLIGVQDDIFPNLKVTADLDEETRLFYVAITRAKRHLTLSNHQGAHGEPGCGLFMNWISRHSTTVHGAD